MSDATQIAESISKRIEFLHAELTKLSEYQSELERLEFVDYALNDDAEQSDHSTVEKRQRAKRASKSLAVKAHKSQEKKTRGKLTQEIADQIRQINGSPATIAKDFGISRTMVYKIRSGKSWAPTHEAIAEPETTASTSAENVAADIFNMKYESLSHRQLVALHRERKIPTGHDRRKATLVANLVANDQLAEDVAKGGE